MDGGGGSPSARSMEMLPSLCSLYRLKGATSLSLAAPHQEEWAGLWILGPYLENHRPWMTLRDFSSHHSNTEAVVESGGSDEPKSPTAVAPPSPFPYVPLKTPSLPACFLLAVIMVEKLWAISSVIQGPSSFCNLHLLGTLGRDTAPFWALVSNACPRNW